MHMYENFLNRSPLLLKPCKRQIELNKIEILMLLNAHLVKLQ
jgi:hypothetical protein